MNVGLFPACYVNQLYPGAAIVTLQWLGKLGVNVTYPKNRTCCGQPIANPSFEHLTGGWNGLLFKNFAKLDYIVPPSDTCVLPIQERLQSSTHEPSKTANVGQSLVLGAHGYRIMPIFLTSSLLHNFHND